MFTLFGTYLFIFLQTIYLSLGKRIYIDKLAFHGLKQLDILNILDTELSSAPPLTGIQHHLASLEFRKNKLTSSPSNYFSRCENLSVLKLKHNHLTTLPNLSAVSDALFIFDVSYNDLIDISSLQDVTFSHMEFLRLGNNKIQQVNVSRIHIPRLRRLHLMHNLIEELGNPKLLVLDGDEAIDLREFQATLLLSGNPWNCNGQLSWIGLAIQSWQPYDGTVNLYWNGSSVHIVNAQAMVCHMPRGMRGKPALCVGRQESNSSKISRYIVGHLDGITRSQLSC